MLHRKTDGSAATRLTMQIKHAVRELLHELAVRDLELRGGRVVAHDCGANLARDGRLEVVVEIGLLVRADPEVTGEQRRARWTCRRGATWDAAPASDGRRWPRGAGRESRDWDCCRRD